MTRIKIPIKEYESDVNTCIAKYCPQGEQVMKWTVGDEFVYMDTEPIPNLVVPPGEEGKANDVPSEGDEVPSEKSSWYDFLDRSAKVVISDLQNETHSREELEAMFEVERGNRDRVGVKKAITEAMS